MPDRDRRSAPEGAKASAAEAWVAKAIDDTCGFSRRFLATEAWLVIPVESAQHFDKHDAVRIVKAAKLLGAATLRCVLLEDLRAVRNHFEFDATDTGLTLFNQEFGHFNCALLPEDLSFSVICTTNDYYLVAGPEEFVEAATGKRVSEARAEFWRFANDDLWGPVESQHLVRTARRYEVE